MHTNNLVRKFKLFKINKQWRVIKFNKTVVCLYFFSSVKRELLVLLKERQMELDKDLFDVNIDSAVKRSFYGTTI